MKIFISIILFALSYLSGFSQGGCSYQFFCGGTGIGNYLPNTNETITVCPSAINEVVTVNFLTFNVEPLHDGLFVYNGGTPNPNNQISSGNPAGSLPIAGAFWGNTIPGPFTSSAPDGCLTFVFRTDSSTQLEAPLANVTCAIPQGFMLNAFLDNNGNGTKDNTETGFPWGQFSVEANNSGVISYINNAGGSYVVSENSTANNYDFNYTIDPVYNSFYNLTIPSYTNSNIGTSTSLIPVNFPVTSTSNYNDLGINIATNIAVVAGFNYFPTISYTNYGNQTIANGTINFTNDAATPIMATSVPVTTTVTGFTYNFANLLPFETRTIDVTMSVPSIPTVAIGQSITNTVEISSTAAETSLANNNSSAVSQIIASYDPNDITEAHGPEILFSAFAPNDYLTYTIRFENTGNAPAEKVRLTNPLDAAIDETSVKIVASSNNYILERIANNLTFKFDNIQLPPSVPNTTIGKGFVTYKAKLKPGFAVGTIIPNAAKIYFDTNPAIDTNIFETKFVSVLANANFNALNDIKIFPNPVKNLFSISNKNNFQIQSVEISNMLGQTLQMNINNNNIDVSDLKSGSYILKIVTEKGTSNTKFIKE